MTQEVNLSYDQLPSKFMKQKMVLMDGEIEELKDAVRYLEFKLIEKKQEQEAIMIELEEANSKAKDHLNQVNHEQVKATVQDK